MLKFWSPVCPSDFIQLLTLSLLAIWFLSVPHCNSIHPLCPNKANAEFPNYILIGNLICIFDVNIFKHFLKVSVACIHIYVVCKSLGNIQKSEHWIPQWFTEKRNIDRPSDPFFSWSTKGKESVLDKIIIGSEKLL